MPLPPNYFDHAASSPVLPDVLEAMLPWLGAHCGNEHSLHAWGREAREAVDQARIAVAQLIGAEDPSQIVFTSGATEGNNAVIAQFDRVAYSPFEHSSVREAALARPSARVVAPETSPPSPLSFAEGEGEPELTCQMAVSNETGEVFLFGAETSPRKGEGAGTTAKLLVDATQAVGKVPFVVGDADFVTLSGHKFGGPKGVGALYIHEPSEFVPLFRGGGHEHGMRSGTLNVPGIAGLGVAAGLARIQQPEGFERASQLRQRVKEALAGAKVRVNESAAKSPFILSLTCFGLLAEAVVVEVDTLGFGISAGAACGSQNPQPSSAHLARGMTVEESRATIRVSFGPGNTEESATALGAAIKRAVAALSR